MLLHNPIAKSKRAHLPRSPLMSAIFYPLVCRMAYRNVLYNYTVNPHPSFPLPINKFTCHARTTRTGSIIREMSLQEERVISAPSNDPSAEGSSAMSIDMAFIAILPIRHPYMTLNMILLEAIQITRRVASLGYLAHLCKQKRWYVSCDKTMKWS